MPQLSMMVGRMDGSAPYTWHSNQHNHHWHRHGRGSEQHQIPESQATPRCHWNQEEYQPKAKRLFSQASFETPTHHTGAKSVLIFHRNTLNSSLMHTDTLVQWCNTCFDFIPYCYHTTIDYQRVWWWIYKCTFLWVKVPLLKSQFWRKREEGIAGPELKIKTRKFSSPTKWKLTNQNQEQASKLSRPLALQHLRLAQRYSCELQ